MINQLISHVSCVQSRPKRMADAHFSSSPRKVIFFIGPREYKTKNSHDGIETVDDFEHWSIFTVRNVHFYENSIFFILYGKNVTVFSWEFEFFLVKIDCIQGHPLFIFCNGSHREAGKLLRITGVANF